MRLRLARLDHRATPTVIVSLKLLSQTEQRFDRRVDSGAGVMASRRVNCTSQGFGETRRPSVGPPESQRPVFLESGGAASSRYGRMEIMKASEDVSRSSPFSSIVAMTW